MFDLSKNLGIYTSERYDLRMAQLKSFTIDGDNYIIPVTLKLSKGGELLFTEPFPEGDLRAQPPIPTIYGTLAIMTFLIDNNISNQDAIAGVPFLYKMKRSLMEGNLDALRPDVRIDGLLLDRRASRNALFRAITASSGHPGSFRFACYALFGMEVPKSIGGYALEAMLDKIVPTDFGIKSVEKAELFVKLVVNRAVASRAGAALFIEQIDAFLALHGSPITRKPPRLPSLKKLLTPPTVKPQADTP